jgi:hypothetical protein
MASSPTKFAVSLFAADGKQGMLLVFNNSGAANAAITTINENSDGAATMRGVVHELPMTLNGDFDPDEVTSTFRRDFHRAVSGRVFLEARDVERHQDDDGMYWSCVALWAFVPAPPAAPEIVS